MKRKIISTIIILFGISVFLYPISIEKYQEYKRNKIAKEWEESFILVDKELSNIEVDDIKEEIEDLEVIDQIDVLEENTKPQLVEKDKNIDGILVIDKIDLNLPILKGTNKRNLDTSVTTIEKTGEKGEIGNYSIAGHRNRRYGSIFNRLDEVDVGDTIDVLDNGIKYTYQVDEKLYVKPEDTWVLDSNGKDKEITLVTCHPITNATHRLIIKGKIIE